MPKGSRADISFLLALCTSLDLCGLRNSGSSSAGSAVEYKKCVFADSGSPTYEAYFFICLLNHPRLLLRNSGLLLSWCFCSLPFFPRTIIRQIVRCWPCTLTQLKTLYYGRSLFIGKTQSNSKRLKHQLIYYGALSAGVFNLLCISFYELVPGLYPLYNNLEFFISQRPDVLLCGESSKDEGLYSQKILKKCLQRNTGLWCKGSFSEANLFYSISSYDKPKP